LGVALHRIGSTDLKMSERADGFVEHNSAIVENFLELGGFFFAFMRSQIGFTAYMDGIENGCLRQPPLASLGDRQVYTARNC